MGLASRLLARFRNGARIIHPDGRVTKCLLLMDTVKPPFGVEHVATVVVPLGVTVNKEVDKVEIDRLPHNTLVRVISLSRSALSDGQETRLGPLSSCAPRLP